MSAGDDLFGGPAPRLVTIPAAASFLDVLADATASALLREDHPFSLADAIVLLPNRRAARGLMDAFARRLGGAALVPVMRPLADLDDDPDVWGAEPLSFAIPAAIDPLRRRLELAALVRAREAAAGGVDDPMRALAFADELCALLDGAAAAEGVDWSRLNDLVADEALAAHWRQSAAFLDIIATYWPQRLAADGLLDPATRRNAVLDALGAAWTVNPPTRPIVIAGSTGSIAATRRLMAVAAGLPMGVVVLPGLDQSLDADAWDCVGPQHPQFALKETLKALGIERDGVSVLGGDGAITPRALLVREALAPADTTADWLKRLDAAGGEPVVRAGVSGLTLVEAETEEDEASVAALALREALEESDVRVALVTPSAAMARRVAGKLARWGLTPATSVGRPLSDTPSGALVCLLIALSGDDGEPVSLAGLLKHPLCEGFDPQEAAAFEHAHLRGARRHADLAGLAALGAGASAAIAGHLLGALHPLRAFSGPGAVSLGQFADGIAGAMEALAQERAWRGPDGEAAAHLISGLIAHGEALGPMRADQAQRALLGMIRARETPPELGGDTRVSILGPLEARLQRRDLIVLGGLNEGDWPEAPREDAFLSRRMREALGLPSPDVRVGLAAHDFAQLSSNARVLLTRAKRKDGAPTVASRWVWRLATLTKGATGTDLSVSQEGKRLLAFAHALDAPDGFAPIKPPAPRPPAHLRLKRLSVTDAETLVRDPYALYAKRILGLRALRAVGAAPGPAERGVAIHSAIEAFVSLPVDQQTPEALQSTLRAQLVKAGFSAVEVAADGARLALAAERFVAWEGERRPRVRRIFTEVPGSIVLRGGETLSGQADRIDVMVNGGAQILDLKSGRPPSDKQVSTGLNPQLPLEAVMLARGAFTDIRGKAEALIYWHFGGRDPGPRIVNLGDGAHEEGERALARLETMLERYANADIAFLSKPRAQFANARADYDLLARRQEWANAGDEE